MPKLFPKTPELRGALLLGTLLTAAAAAQAEDTAPAGSRSPGDLEEGERREMMLAASRYDACVFNKAMEIAGEHDDIRRAADAARGAGGGKLDALREGLACFAVDAFTIDAFSRRVQSRATRKILPELAIRKAR